MTDAPERIWAWEERGARWHYGGWNLTGQSDRNDRVEYLRADLVPDWSSDMDAAPKDGTVILAVPWGPATGLEDVAPTYWIASEERWANWWWSSEPTHWMLLHAPPSKGRKNAKQEK